MKKTNESPNCLECSDGILLPSTWSFDTVHRGKTVHITDLECYTCDKCGASPVFADQIKRNESKIKKAKRKRIPA